MVTDTLSGFDGECQPFSSNFYSNMPMSSLPPKLRVALVKKSEEVLEFFKENPQVINLPYGYTVFKNGKVIWDDEWEEKNILAARMRELGFEKYKASMKAPFSDCYYQERRLNISRSTEMSRWTDALALSAMALLLIHILNIYHPKRGLLNNMFDATLEYDALNRPNYRPTISAIAKQIKKSLGWKGESENRAEYRAEIVVALIEYERSNGQKLGVQSSGIEFELKCAKLLRDKGFDVQETASTGDFGADLIASKEGVSFAIQCKNLSKPVGIKAVQEAIGARRHYVVDFSIVCADSGFTDAALELASTNAVITTRSGNLADSLDNAARISLS